MHRHLKIAITILMPLFLLLVSTSCSCNCSTGSSVNPGGWNPGGIGIESPRVAFVSDYEGQNEVYVMNKDGSDITKLTESYRNSIIHSLSWSPDGNKISFVRYTKLWIMDTDGENEIQIHGNMLISDPPISWSPDSSKVAYQFWGHIEIDGCDGTDVSLIEVGQGNYLQPAWSPDGNRIAVVYENYSRYEIHVMDPDGLNEINLTQYSVFNNDFPTWSPDGTKIACRFSYDNIEVMDADGSNQAKLLDDFEHGVKGSSVSWSPDGSKIVFSIYDEPEDIYVINSDGTNLINLTDSPSSDLYPSWYPDSTKVAFQSDRDGDWDIYVVNTDGSGLKNITNSIENEQYPVWSPWVGQS